MRGFQRFITVVAVILMSYGITSSASATGTIDITGVTPSSPQFYPVVQDGYRDTDGFTASSTVPIVKAVWQVFRDDGTLLRTVNKTSNARYWAWDGLYASGTPVKVGTYVVKIRGYDESGHSDYATTKVDVVTGYVSKTYRKYTYGANGHFSSSGTCFISTEDTSEVLDAWDGTCTANYYFPVPSSAFNIYGAANGARTEDDICCTGKITQAFSRTSSTVVRVTIKVNFFRAWRVDSAYVRYAVKVKV